MINHIISKWRKFAQNEYKTRHDGVEKVIHWELSKKLKFDHMNKYHLLYPEFVLENETQDFSGILRYKQISKSRPEDQT